MGGEHPRRQGSASSVSHTNADPDPAAYPGPDPHAHAEADTTSDATANSSANGRAGTDLTASDESGQRSDPATGAGGGRSRG